MPLIHFDRGLNHSNILKLIKYIPENKDNISLIVMELVDGGDLQSLLSNRTEPLG